MITWIIYFLSIGFSTGIGFVFGIATGILLITAFQDISYHFRKHKDT